MTLSYNILPVYLELVSGMVDGVHVRNTARGHISAPHAISTAPSLRTEPHAPSADKSDYREYRCSPAGNCVGEMCGAHQVGGRDLVYARLCGRKGIFENHTTTP